MMLFAALIAAPLLALQLGSASSEDAATRYPVKPIRMIVGFPAGGVSDNIARLIGQKLSEAWGQQVVMDNRPGAGGIISMEMAARAPADGYTLAITSPGMLTITPQVNPKVAYDPVKSYAPVSLLVTANQLLMANPSLPAQSVKELVALARSRPGQLNYASSGNGTIPHLAGELFRMLANVDIVHVPYKGSGPALTDLISGQVQIGFGPISTGLPQVRTGKLRALGVTGSRRSAGAPDIPTIAEAGVPKFDVTTWTALIAPAATPPEIVRKIGAEVRRAMRLPDVRERLSTEGVEPVGSSAEEFAEHIRLELAKWRELIRRTGVKMESSR